MILNDLLELNTKFNLVKNLDKTKTLKDALQSRENSLSSAKSALESLKTTKTALEAVGIDVEYKYPNGERTSEQAAVLLDKFKDDQETIINQDEINLQYQFIVSIEPNVRTGKQELLKIWQEYLGSFLDIPQRGFVEALGKIPQLSQKITQVKNLMNQIETYQNEIPDNPVNVVTLLKEKNSEINKIMGDLSIDNAPKALRKFLEDVGTPFGAKLSHLSPEIKEWLINENLLDQFVVKFK